MQFKVFHSAHLYYFFGSESQIFSYLLFLHGNKYNSGSSFGCFFIYANHSLTKIFLTKQVRQQHTERTIDFLVDELKVCSTEEAAQRIFFVSAKEALQARLQEQKGQPAQSNNILINKKPVTYRFCSIYSRRLGRGIFEAVF